MSKLEVYCLAATVYSKTGEIDEHNYRKFLNRFSENKIGLYLASGGNGESHALSWEELRRVYEIGVSECKGKVPVQANLPESHTAKGTIEQCQLAIDAGVELLHLYTLEERHGMRPTDAEYMAYFDDILSAIKHPVMISANPTVGYMPKPQTLNELCNKYHQIVGIRLSGVPDTYLINLKDAMSRKISYCVILPTSMNAFHIGVDGIFSSKANLVPKTVRQYADLYDKGDLPGINKAYMDLKRLYQHVMKWHPAGARWIKMGMQVLKIPGWEGGVRKPYLMPPAEEITKFTDGLLKLRIPEITELARAAGLSVPD